MKTYYSYSLQTIILSIATLCLSITGCGSSGGDDDDCAITTCPIGSRLDSGGCACVPLSNDDDTGTVDDDDTLPPNDDDVTDDDDTLPPDDDDVTDDDDTNGGPTRLDEAEPNDERDEATHLSRGEYEIAGELDAGRDDDDYWTFVGVGGQQVELLLTDLPSGADFDLYLWEFPESDQVNDGLFTSQNLGSQDEEIILDTMDSAEYFIHLHAYDGRGSYTLRVHFDEWEGGSGYGNLVVQNGYDTAITSLDIHPQGPTTSCPHVDWDEFGNLLDDPLPPGAMIRVTDFPVDSNPWALQAVTHAGITTTNHMFCWIDIREDVNLVLPLH